MILNPGLLHSNPVLSHWATGAQSYSLTHSDNPDDIVHYGLARKHKSTTQPTAATCNACACNDWPLPYAWCIKLGTVAAACRASCWAIRKAVRLLSNWAAPWWQILHHLDLFTASAFHVAGWMLDVFSVALRTSLYRLCWPPQDCNPLLCSCSKRRTLGMQFSPHTMWLDQRGWDAMMIDSTLVIIAAEDRCLGSCLSMCHVIPQVFRRQPVKNCSSLLRWYMVYICDLKRRVERATV